MNELLKGLRTYVPPAATTAREVGKYASEEDVERVLTRLSHSRYSKHGQVCYVHGTGKLPQSVYVDLQRQPGVRVVYSERAAPKFFRFIPGYKGLVKIEDPAKLPEVFDKVTGQSTAICLIFDGNLEASVVATAQNVESQRDDTFGIQADLGHLIYLVDADRDDSPTAMVHFLSFGGAGPWTDLFADL